MAIYDIPKLRPLKSATVKLDPEAWGDHPIEAVEGFQAPDEVERDAAAALMALEILRLSDSVIGFLPVTTAAAVNFCIAELDKLFSRIPAGETEEEPF